MPPDLQFIQDFKGPSCHAPRQVMTARLVGWAQSREEWQQTQTHLSTLLDALRPANVAMLEQSLPPLDAPGTAETPSTRLAQTAITLQRWAGHPTTLYGPCPQARAEGEVEDTHDFYFEYALALTGKRAASLACALMRIASGPAQPRRALAQDAFAQFAKQNLNNQNRAAYLRLARDRNIPWRCLTPSSTVLAFGQGCHTRWISSNFSDRTGFIATQLSTNKFEAASALRQHGIPVPRQHIASDIATALKAAQHIGYPVVVKPLGTDHGTAVSTGLQTDDDVRQAYRLAAKHGPVLIESQLPGMHHRLTVIHGKMTSARRQTPAHVTGDGARSIAELVEEKNKARRAQNIWAIDLNEESDMILARAGRDRHTVPDAGEIIELHSHSNLVAGGTMMDVTDQVHPDNRKLAERTAAIMGIDVAGLDFLSPDISRSYLEVGGGFCEVNVTPAFIFDEHQILFDAWFPPPAGGRIPVIALLGVDDDLARGISEVLAQKAERYSWASHQGLFIDGSCVDRAPNDTVTGMERACTEPTSRAALIELDPENIRHEGLGVDQIDILIMGKKARQDAPPQEARAMALVESISRQIHVTTSAAVTAAFLDHELTGRL